LPTSADQGSLSAVSCIDQAAEHPDMRQLHQGIHIPKIQPISKVETIWEQVQLARHVQRPHFLAYLASLCQDFTELRGDRCFGDDRALLGGLASLDGRNILVLGQQKGQNLAENMQHNFGMPSPDGYRKATRLLKLAEKFHLPVVCFIDTPGASPDLSGEERGIAQAIAENMRVMAGLRVPIISVVIGEGGSGGALALGIADRILMLEHSIYTITSPEVTALLLWHDVAAAPQAAAALKMTSEDLWQAHLIDEIVAEPPTGAHTDPAGSASLLKAALLRNLIDLEHALLDDTPARDRLVARRAAKIRAMGVWREQ
jgi:acetyl-CoA carboxylase carboxyl transferase subunit alpha